MKNSNNTNGEYIKIVIYGTVASGKTTFLETLYQICNKGDKKLKPSKDLKKIDMATGRTIYFDKGVFTLKDHNEIFHIFTVAGQSRWKPLRKKVLQGAKFILFVVDSQRSRIPDNVDSLKELRRILKENNIEKMPFLLIMNKQDLDDTISLAEWEVIMEDEGIFLSDGLLETEKPIGFETIAIFEENKNIYESIIEVIRRITEKN